jgi:hypothetical protein
MFGKTYFLYVIRIQLPGDSADYSALHQRMEVLGCTRTIDTKHGQFHLPHGEYFLSSPETFDKVGEHAIQIARAVSPEGRPQVLVMQVLNWSFDLDPVEKPVTSAAATGSAVTATSTVVDESSEIQLSGILLESMREEIRSLGVLREDGFQELNEKLYKDIDDFRVIFYPNESRHPGRPHCKVEIGGKTANYDLKTLKPLVGDVGRYQRTVDKVLTKHQSGLLKFWDDTRPTDQKLAKK